MLAQALSTEQREVHTQQAASFTEVAAKVGGEELPDAETLAELSEQMEEQMYRNLQALKETLTQLQLGGGDLSEGSLGYSLWTILSQLEENICDTRSSNYLITFQADYQSGRLEAAVKDELISQSRSLLATGGGSSGGSSAGRVSQPFPPKSSHPPVNQPTQVTHSLSLRSLILIHLQFLSFLLLPLFPRSAFV
jgi:hypothetical protein